MANGKGLQSRHHQNAAAHLGVDLDIVGYLEVVDYRVEHFVDFSARSDQTNALEPVDDVVLRLTVPGALRLNGSKVIGRFGVVLHRGLYQDLAQFLFLTGMPEVVAPKPRLRPEVQPLRYGVMQIALLAVNKRRHPDTWLYVGSPAVEVEVPAGVPVAAVPAVKPHNVVILILDPDAPQETAFAGLLHRGHVEHQAAHFPKKFTPHVIELVMLLVEPVGVDEDHLQESPGYEFRRERKEVADGAKDLPSLAVGVGQGNQGHALGKIRAAKKVFVARGHGPEFFVRPLVLNVGLDQRRVLADLLDGPVF